MTHDIHPTTPPHTHTPPPYSGGCEEVLSNERRGLLHRVYTYTQTYGHRDSMTESAQWADSVKNSQLKTGRTCHKPQTQRPGKPWPGDIAEEEPVWPGKNHKLYSLYREL